MNEKLLRGCGGRSRVLCEFNVSRLVFFFCSCVLVVSVRMRVVELWRFYFPVNSPVSSNLDGNQATRTSNVNILDLPQAGGRVFLLCFFGLSGNCPVKCKPRNVAGLQIKERYIRPEKSTTKS
jgi:hypothetical protein